MDDLLNLAGQLIENNNYKNNTYEENKPDGEYSVVIQSIKLKESQTTGTEWYNITAKVLEGDYVDECFFINLFLTEKTIRRTLSKLMSLVDACGFNLEVSMFNDKDSILEGLQNIVGSTVKLVKKTSTKGFINYSFEEDN